MGQWRRLRQRGVECRWRRTDRRTQRTVQRVTGGRLAIGPLHDQFHGASAGTDQVHPVWVDDGRRNRHTHRQRKPHQHKAGELDGVAQEMHALDYEGFLTSIKKQHA